MADQILLPLESAHKPDHRRSDEMRRRTIEFNQRTKRKYPKEYDSKSRLHTIWRAMIFRCYYPSHEAFPRYGGAGILICDEWRNDYGAFMRWAIDSGYRDTLTIDRIENAKGYEPENCRWATMVQQQRNRTDNFIVTAFGETKTAKEWSCDCRCSISYASLHKRFRAGMVPEEAISNKPIRAVRIAPIVIAAFGEIKTPSQWVLDSRCQTNVHALTKRIDAGWAAEDAITKAVKPMKARNAEICIRGHAMTPENTRLEGRGKRCRACGRLKDSKRASRSKKVSPTPTP